MKIKIFISGSIVFLAVIACVVPGLGQPAAPTLDVNNLPTVIALTAHAAMTQTAAVAPPTPAGISDPSGTAEVIDLTAVTTLEQLPDGSTKFTDTEVGFTVTFPKGWLTLRPNSEEFKVALENEAAKNDLLRSQMELDLKDYDPEDRLYSYPVLPEIEKDYLFGFSSIQWDPGDTTPIDQNSMGDFLRDLETSGAIPGFRTDTAQVYESGRQVPLIEVGGPFTISDGQGGFIPFYMTSVFFRPTHGGVVLMLFTYLKDYKLDVHTDLISVIDSVELVGQ
ncbi:hypothetical protein ANAEL_02627 [Anaerolineales bacterium]|nr:hypothetical protein ANAEL_02627 [Anaerolineales bacterium]